MFIWHIGSNILSTNLNFVQKVGYRDSVCPLCRLENESSVHLFFHCQSSKAIWFGQGWGFRPGSIPLANCLDIVKLVVTPPLPHGSNNNRNLLCKMSIQIALTLECIWNFRNSIVHSGPHSNLPIILKGLELRVADHLALVEGVDRVSNNVLIC